MTTPTKGRRGPGAPRQLEDRVDLRVYVSAATAEEIDRRRGEESRSSWIRRLIEEAVERGVRP